MIKKIVISFCISVLGAILVGLSAASCTSGKFSLNTLLLPGVIPVMALICLGVAVVFTPITFWAYKPEKLFSFITLGILLSIFCIIFTPKFPAIGIYGSVLLGIIGLVVIHQLK